MRSNWFPVLLFIIVAIVTANEVVSNFQMRKNEEKEIALFIQNMVADTMWPGKDVIQIPVWTDSGKLIKYGHELIANTSYYLGPKGTVAQITNGMNCQNCHLNGGTVPFGNNFGKVYATYPQFRARNNGVQTVYGRISDCLQRSMNGRLMDSSTLEMRAMHAYIQWVGDEVPKGHVSGGTSIMKLPFMDIAADPSAGRKVYNAKCESCHGENGHGIFNEDHSAYIYPPLWGNHSYNDGAGLFRISNFAGFVKNNMPFGTDYLSPQLTDKDCWDVAAYVNSRPRPHFDQHNDWANISRKPVDFPFAPFIDNFSEHQHKYGPFKAIVNAMAKK